MCTSPQSPVLPPPAPDQIVDYLRPTDIAVRLGLHHQTGKPNPHQANLLLAAAGLQAKSERVYGGWEPTEKGLAYAYWRDLPKINAWTGRPQQQLLWRDTVLEVLQGRTGA